MKKLKKALKYIIKQLFYIGSFFFKENKFNIEDYKVIYYSSKFKNKLYNLFNTANINFAYLVDSEKSIKKHHGNIIFDSFEIFPESNADIYILDSITVRKIYSSRFKPNYICLSFFNFFKNFLFLFQFFFRKNYKFNSFQFFNYRPYFLIERVYKREKEKARRYIPINFNRISFLIKITELNFNYSVLRWYDSIKDISNYEDDIDILVHKEDTEKLLNFIESSVGIMPLDIYSSDGEETTSYAGLPYFTSKLSNQILENKIIYKNQFYIPNSNDYLISLIYHIVFHKSIKSGLNINNTIVNKFEGNRDYIVILNKIFELNEIKFEKAITLETLLGFIEEQEFKPHYDLILKLYGMKKDKWLSQLVIREKEVINQDYSFIKGLAVFFLRKKAYSIENIELVLKNVEKFGFNVLAHSHIPEENQELINSNVRGGKWDKGIGLYEENAGTPIYYFILYDPFYKSPGKSIKKNYPHLENEKVLSLKKQLREVFNQNFKKTMNSIHSSDDFYEVVFYLEQLGFSIKEINAFISSAKKNNKKYINKHKVIKDYSRTSMRSKVFLIEYEGKECIQKIYNFNSLSYLKREVNFLEKYQNETFVPKLIQVKENFIIMEYISNKFDLNSYSKTLSLDICFKLRNILNKIYNDGITILDLNPTNVIITEENNLVLIDFEYAQNYIQKPKKFIDVYEMGKIPLNKVEVYPNGHENYENAYDLFWKDRFQLSKEQFFYCENVFLLRIYKKINMVTYFVNKTITNYSKRAVKIIGNKK